jgi:RsiW-degrading membrane proteinase PrsW (M82 family)
MILGPTPLSVLLALLIVLPAWLIGFAAPVFAWWSISSRHLGINISRRNAEWILAAGMLSTIPAIIINSLISPLILDMFGLNAMEPGSWGEGFVLFLSAPIGEELSKALAVLALSHLIISPKHGFYVGSTVGLGFALLENAQYISLALIGDYSSISYFFTAMLRGLSSIPGHALWTGLSGYAIGCWIARGNRLPSLSERSSYVTPNTQAKWILYNKNGTPESTTGWANIPSDRMMRFVAKWEKQSWNLPATIPAGIGAAILGHGLWNGTSWGVGRLLSDSDSMISLVLQLTWLGLMIATLWLFILRWLPSVVLDGSDQRF